VRGLKNNEKISGSEQRERVGCMDLLCFLINI